MRASQVPVALVVSNDLQSKQAGGGGAAGGGGGGGVPAPSGGDGGGNSIVTAVLRLQAAPPLIPEGIGFFFPVSTLFLPRPCPPVLAAL